MTEKFRWLIAGRQGDKLFLLPGTQLCLASLRWEKR